MNIKSYSELKQLINHGDKVTLDGKLMTNEKVNRMPMAEVRLCIEQGDFKTNPAIEGEFIGKDDKPDYNPLGGLISGAEAQRRQQAAMQSQFWHNNAARGQAQAGHHGPFGIFGGIF